MNNLKKLREEREIKQIEVANYLKIKQATYSRMETNIETARGNTLKKLAKFFNVSVDYLIGLIDEPEPLKRIEDQKISSENIISKDDITKLETIYEQIGNILKKKTQK